MTRPLATSLLTALLFAAPAFAGDKVYQNDSITSGSNANIQAGFVKNEIAASVFTVPHIDGLVFLQNARVLFFNFLGQATTRQMRILVYASGAVDPGTPVYTSPIYTFIPGGENLVDLSMAKIEWAPGTTFTIGAKFEQEGLFVNFSSVVTDTDGIQAGKNRVFDVNSNTWKTAESLGITGDFGIRCTVTTNGPTHYGAGTAGSAGTPTVDSFGAWKVGNTAFGLQGAQLPAGSTAFIGVSESAVNIPIAGLTLLADPLTMLAFSAPTDPTGAWTLATGVPPNPVLAGLHFYVQVFGIDGGAPQGISASDGLDILISS
jgi:hypothetical protein